MNKDMMLSVLGDIADELANDFEVNEDEFSFHSTSQDMMSFKAANISIFNAYEDECNEVFANPPEYGFQDWDDLSEDEHYEQWQEIQTAALKIALLNCHLESDNLEITLSPAAHGKTKIVSVSELGTLAAEIHF